MNTYNRAVIDRYCFEVHYSRERKRLLIEKLLAKYGNRMDTEDLFRIGTRNESAPATLSPLNPHERIS